MADILNALQNKHISHAPLSHAQTITVCTYLHEATKDAFKQIEDIRTHLSSSDAEVANAHMKIEHTGANMRILEKELASVKQRVSAAEESVGVNVERFQRVQESAAAAHSSIEQLRSGLKVTNTNVQTVREKQQEQREDIARLRKELETSCRFELTGLAEKLQMAVLKLDRLHADHEVSQTDLRGHRDRLRSLEAEADAFRDGIARLTAIANEHAEALGNANHRADNAKDNLEMTNAVVLKMHQELESTRNDVSALRGDHRSLQARHESLKEDHHRSAKESSDGTHGLQKLSAAHGHTATLLQQASRQIAQLQGSYDKAVAALKALGSKVDQLQILATSTQENLQVTNAFVLPNLSTGDSISPGFGGSRESGATVAASAGPGSGRSSPRIAKQKRKEATWITRNIGIVPDRMAWT